MRLQPAAFNRFLANIGQKVTWSRAFACPCINPTSGQPDTKCPQCSGKGHLWVEPKPTVCGLAGQKTQRQWATSGMWTQGDIVVTIPSDSPMWEIGDFDRVAMLNSTDRFSQSLTRGAPGERILFQVEKVERVFWLDKVTRALVEGPLPSMDAAGRPSWQAGAPPAGVQYSITGQRRPEYYCLQDLVSSRNEHSGSRLPKNVVLRRFDLLGRRGAT